MQPDEAYCPRCGKAFDNGIQLQRHMNQPRAKCHNQRTVFVDPMDLLGHFARPDSSTPSSDSDVDMEHFHWQQRSDTPYSKESNSDHSRDGSMESIGLAGDAAVRDHFPGAARIVDQNGIKFMDTFDEDVYSEIRSSDNLYYPFANHPEWELAEYLLTSELSMAAIDRFLSLTLVSFTFLQRHFEFPCNHDYYRLNDSNFHSKLRRSSVDLRKFYPKPLRGSVVGLPPRTTRKEP